MKNLILDIFIVSHSMDVHRLEYYKITKINSLSNLLQKQIKDTVYNIFPLKYSKKIRSIESFKHF